MHIIHFDGGIISVAALEELFFTGNHVVVSTSTGKVICQSVVIPALQRDASGVESFIFNSHYTLVAFFTNNDAGVAPRKVVLVPERIEG